MDTSNFIRKREKSWERLQQLLRGHRGRKSLSAEEVIELGNLYRAVVSDLAVARRDYPKQPVTQFLNQLLVQTHSYIYQQDVSDYRELHRYFTRVIPQTFQSGLRYFVAAFLCFIIPAITGYTLTYTSPDVSTTLGMTRQREILANQSTWTDIPVSERPYASAFIMTNNIRVALLAFGGGVAFGLFTFYVMVYNGLIVGGLLGLAAHYGQGNVLLDFIVAHGVVELSVIFMAGGAGYQMGWALISPGRYSRKDALGLAARKAVPLVVIAIPLLVISGVIEGFISPSSLSFVIKLAVGVGYGLIMYTYLLAGSDVLARAAAGITRRPEKTRTEREPLRP